MDTPIRPDENELSGGDNEFRQYSVLSNLSCVYAAFILLLLLIPNEPAGRLIIACCGMIIVAIGMVIRYLGSKIRKKTLLKTADNLSQ